MGRGFRHDFSGVRVHTGGRAASSAADVGAEAYTLGKDIVFAEGRYAPTRHEGRRLLAHELAHVVQQSRAPASTAEAGGVGAADHPLEQEATAQSQRVLAGGEGAIAGGASGPALLRQANGSASPSPSPGPRDTHQPDPDLTHPRSRTSSNWGLGEFESRLEPNGDGAPCLLTLSLKLAFDFVDTPAGFPTGGGHNAPGTVTRTRWNGGERAQWRDAFIRAVTSRWSYRYPLAALDNNCLFAMGVCNQALARVEVIPVSPAAGVPTVTVSHATGYRSRASGHGAWLARDDIDSGANARGQVTVEHEFGHMIGLDHSNPACQGTDAGPTDPTHAGDSACYGVTSSQIADIMGQGSIVTPQDYRPFVTEMNFFTGCGWQTVGSAPKPPSWAAANRGFIVGLTVGGVLGSVGGAIAGGFMGGSAGAAVLGGVLGGAAGALVGMLGGAIADSASS